MLNSKCYELRPTPGQHPTRIKTKRLNIIISFIKNALGIESQTERHKINHYQLSNVVKKNFHFFSVFHEHNFVFALKRSQNWKIKSEQLNSINYEDFTCIHPSWLGMELPEYGNIKEINYLPFKIVRLIIFHLLDNNMQHSL